MGGVSAGTLPPSCLAVGGSTGFPHAVQNTASSLIDSPHWPQNSTFLHPGRQTSYLGRVVLQDKRTSATGGPCRWCGQDDHVLILSVRTFEPKGAGDRIRIEDRELQCLIGRTGAVVVAEVEGPG